MKLNLRIFIFSLILSNLFWGISPEVHQRVKESFLTTRLVATFPRLTRIYFLINSLVKTNRLIFRQKSDQEHMMDEIEATSVLIKNLNVTNLSEYIENNLL